MLNEANLPHIAINFLQPRKPTKYAVFVVGKLPQLTDTVCLPNKQAIFQISVYRMWSYAAFHWARKLAQKLVFMSFPVGNIVPLKSEVVFPSGKLGILRAPPTSDLEIRVSEPNGMQH